MSHVFRPPPKPGQKMIAYAPLPGHPKDADGALILAAVYAATGVTDGLRPASGKTTVAEVEAKVAAGMKRARQGLLI